MRKFLFIFLIGALASYAMAPTNYLWSLFIGLSLLFVLVFHSKDAFAAFGYAFVFSLGYFGLGLSWIGNALLVEDNPYRWAWPIAVSGLPLILSLFPAFACAIHKAICKDKNNVWAYLSFCFFLSVSEFARGHLFTGFPWNLYGYTWISVMPIAQLASLSNIYLLTAITIIWATFPGYLLKGSEGKSVKMFLSLLLVLSFSLAYMFGSNRINSEQNDVPQDVSFVIVQPNIEQSQKWKKSKIAENFMSMIEQSKFQDTTTGDVSGSYLVVWPETAVSQGLMNAPWAMIEIRNMLNSYPSESYLITGALRIDEDKDKGTFHNSMVVFDSEAEIIGTYDKSHLVPFGEYMPLSNIIDIAPIVGFTGFEKGDGQNLMTLPNDIKMGALICYEVIFPRYVASENNEKPNFYVNVTNDAWYGDSAGPHQHLVQTQFRAIESERSIIRSANTGISAYINSTGMIVNSIPLNDKNAINQKARISID